MVDGMILLLYIVQYCKAPPTTPCLKMRHEHCDLDYFLVCVDLVAVFLHAIVYAGQTVISYEVVYNYVHCINAPCVRKYYKRYNL